MPVHPPVHSLPVLLALGDLEEPLARSLLGGPGLRSHERCCLRVTLSYFRVVVLILRISILLLKLSPAHHLDEELMRKASSIAGGMLVVHATTNQRRLVSGLYS